MQDYTSRCNYFWEINVISSKSALSMPNYTSSSSMNVIYWNIFHCIFVYECISLMIYICLQSCLNVPVNCNYSVCAYMYSDMDGLKIICLTADFFSLVFSMDFYVDMFINT